MFGNTFNADRTPAIIHAVGLTAIAVGIIGSTIMSLVQLFG